MTITPQALNGGVALGTATAALYTAPANTKAVIKKAVFTNISASTVTATVSITRSGGSAITLISAQSLAAGQAYVSPELAGQTLLSGDVVSAQASTAGVVNAFLSGFTFT